MRVQADVINGFKLIKKRYISGKAANNFEMIS